MVPPQIPPFHPLSDSFFIQAGNIAQSLVNLNYSISADPEDTNAVRSLANQALLQARELASLLQSAAHSKPIPGSPALDPTGSNSAECRLHRYCSTARTLPIEALHRLA
jgi:hypothetical protein